MKNKWVIPLILLAVFLKQLAWVVFMPLWQTPDEQAHFAQVSVMAELDSSHVPPLNTSFEIIQAEHVLGVYRNNKGDNFYTFRPNYNIVYSSGVVGPDETYLASMPKETRTKLLINEATDYPRLYYWLSAIAYSTFDEGTIFDRVFAIRLLNCLMIVALVYITGKIGGIIFKKNIEVWSLMIFVGFAPMLSFVYSGVTSDTLFNLLFTFFIWRGLLLIKNGLVIKELIIITLTIGLAVLTKVQANVMAIIFVPLALYLFLTGKNKSKPVIFSLAALLALSLVGIVWRIMSGAPIIPETERLSSLNFSAPTILEHARFTLTHTYREVLPWFWGVFRWLSLGLPSWLRQITNAVTLAGLGLFTILLTRSLQLKKLDRENKYQLFLAFCGCAYFLALTVFDFGFRQANGYSFGIQGRYFFPIIVPIFAMILLGLRRVSSFLALGMIIFNLYVFAFLTLSYFDSQLGQYLLQASQYKPVWLKYPVNLLIILPFVLTSGALLGLIANKTVKSLLQLKR